ncbi:MAG: hypothetical protein ACKOW2_08340 [Sphingobacteriaceae bacterium]
MKNAKTNISPFILVLIPIMLGLVYLATNTDIQIPTEKYSASLHFQVPSYQVVVKFVYACFSW